MTDKTPDQVVDRTLIGLGSGLLLMLGGAWWSDRWHARNRQVFDEASDLLQSHGPTYLGIALAVIALALLVPADPRRWAVAMAGATAQAIGALSDLAAHARRHELVLPHTLETWGMYVLLAGIAVAAVVPARAPLGDGGSSDGAPGSGAAESASTSSRSEDAGGGTPQDAAPDRTS